MQNKDVTALIKMSTFAVLLCAVLLILGNIGLTSSLPVMVMNHLNIIHVGFYIAFNAMFIGFLGYLLHGRSKAVTTLKRLSATA
ncbi:hypothetical protein [Photobacterium nomapromontoriensis]|uniref:hypothetical protein n=1 Tax=Photobacterium nomapromontoriensis TaxID=2910237 RepID=UPI003D0F35E0